MSASPAIHQFNSVVTPGDGITNSLLYTRRLLRELGFQSEIFAESIHPALADEVQPLGRIPKGKDYLLLFHHGLGYRNTGWLDALQAPVVLVYHNITPAHLLPPGEFPALSVFGREQVRDWAKRWVGGIGMSEYNSDELRSAGYKQILTLPLLVDMEALRARPYDESLCSQLRDTLNILFVGRVAEHKRQHELIEMFDVFQRLTTQPSRLIMAGGLSSDGYGAQLKAMAESRLPGRVVLPGKVSDAGIQSLYRCADVFVCLSEHEGFGMPIIESMVHDVPVVTRAAGALADTMGEGGLVLAENVTDPAVIAATVHRVTTEPGLRRRMIAGQRRNLRRFSTPSLKARLAEWLQKIGYEAPLLAQAQAEAKQQAALDSQQYWRVEGPVDSTYSLAHVNREVAVGLAERGQAVALQARSGTADPAWLQQHAPTALPLVQESERRLAMGRLPEVTLRFDYPPWVDAMAGVSRFYHSYGWEEALFPAQYVAAFNRRLDGVTVLSRQVARALRDSGVRIPLPVVGAGADHIVRQPARAFTLPPEVTQARFRFLHVSSCFPRKGIDALLAAYGQAFRAGDDVVLVIKTFPNPHNDVAQQLARLRAADATYPAVAIINEDIDLAALRWLYEQCQALVAPSRGEGFGLPLAEAMWLGLPVITTAWGGQTDFCRPDTAWLCDYTFAPAEAHVSAPDSVWADPDVTHLAALMREVHAVPATTRAVRTDAARALVQRECTWAEVARRTAEAVAAVQAGPLLRREPRLGWMSTWEMRCGIAHYSSFLLKSLPASRVTVLVSEQSGVPEDSAMPVVPCWEQHGGELDIEPVLAAVREHGLEAVVIQYNFGFYSVTSLGRLLAALQAAGVATYVFLHATQDQQRSDGLITLADARTELSGATRVLVHSVSDLNRLRALGIVDNATLLAHGMGGVQAVPTPVERRAAGMEGRRVVATYGFLLPHKGVRELIQAFALMAAKDPSLELWLLTALHTDPISAREYEICSGLIERLGLTDRVRFVTDYQTDAETLAQLRMADVIVMPYLHTQESASGAVRIAIASGRPVAVTNLPIFADVAQAVFVMPHLGDALAEIEAQREAAVGAPILSVEELVATLPQSPLAVPLADSVFSLLNDVEHCFSIGRRAAAWAQARHWEALSLRLIDMIDGDANDL